MSGAGTTDPGDLAERWSRLVRALGADPAAEPARRHGAALIAAYGEAHRAYHDAAHLNALLDRLQVWEDRAADLPALQLTAFLHDAVYDGRPGDDEAASARWAEICGAELGLSTPRTDKIVRWILATAGHGPQPDSDGAVFLDADLEILGAEEPAYDAYAAAIRREYAHVPHEAFREGRRNALSGFLGRPRIYQHARTPTFWESRARDNIARELERL